MKKTLLLVDDNALQLKLNAARLVDAGFEVRTATGGGEALESARRAVPDLIVSDVLMQDFDGFHLCQRIRQDSVLTKVPVVLLSAHFSGERDKALATAVGANDLAERTPDFSRELAAVTKVMSEGEPAPAAAEASRDLYAQAFSGQVNTLLAKVSAAEARWNTLLDHATDVISVMDLNGVVVDVNKSCELLSGRTRAELIGKHVSALTAEGDANYGALFAEAISGAASRPVEVTRADGKKVMLQYAVTMTEHQGQKLVLCVGRDVTTELDSARALAETQQSYQVLIDNLIDVAWVGRLSDGQLLAITPNVKDLTGFEADELVKQGPPLWQSRIHRDDLPRTTEALQTLRTTRVMDVEYRFQHRGGSWRWLRSRARLSRRGGIDVLDGMVADVTQRKHLEDEVRQAQKMEALGQLTAGVAHDFNNLLCVILANADMVQRTFTADDPRREDVASIREAGDRCAALTRQLMAFCRKQVMQPKVLDLNGVVVGVKKMLGRLIGEDVQLTLRTAADPVNVFADAGQLEQVLVNLAVNARDAMPAGGELTLETSPLDLVESPDLAPGRYVRLTVSDTGCGMSPETQRQIFEPFFTTKPVGKGTGMGLSTCYGIVVQTGGRISVRSAPGKGTSFTVLLPAAPVETVAAVTKTELPSPKGNETVLVVEDDDIVRQTLSRCLSRLGYEVLVANDGEQATTVFRANRDRIALVVTDVVMPGKNGIETVAMLRADGFEGKSLLMSGYTDRPEVLGELAKPGVSFLPKPFVKDVLACRVREVLDA